MSIENAVRYICEQRKVTCHYDYVGGLSEPKMTPEKKRELDDRKFKLELERLANGEF